ncbi:MAG: hypothetical protein ABIO02_02765 [Patescibacteria group bacterium]
MASIEFTLSYDGELLIKKEDTVSFQTPLYNLQKKESISVPLAKLLGTDPTKIFQSLKKFVGDQVVKGDIIAESASFMSKRSYTSEYDGVLKEVDHQEGILIIEAGSEAQDTINCFFVGEVTDIKEEKSESGMNKATLKLKVKTSKEFELKDVTSDFGGEVVYCDDPIKAKLTADEVCDKVVVDDKVPSYEQVKYEALGAKGFVSVDTLPEPTQHFAQLSSEADFKKIFEHKHSYCLINKTDNKIFLYE